MMVTIKNFLLLAGAGLALSVYSSAWAGNIVLDIGGVRISTNGTDPTPLIYSMLPVASLGGGNHPVVAVNLSKFLFCNDFAPEGSSTYTGMRVRPYFGSWVFGFPDAPALPNATPPLPAVTHSFTRLKGFTYVDGTLTVEACDAYAGSTDCRPDNAPAYQAVTLQCYAANADGTGVEVTRGIFAASFENHDNTSVAINFPPNQVPAQNAQDPYIFEVSFSIPGNSPAAAPQAVPPAGNAPQSLTTSHYILQVGYNSRAFSKCEALGLYYGDGGLYLDALTPNPKLIACYPKNPNFNPVTVQEPVFAAALFVGPQALTESVYTNNVAFYPAPPAPPAQ